MSGTWSETQIVGFLMTLLLFFKKYNYLFSAFSFIFTVYEQRRHFKSLRTHHESHGIGEIRPRRIPFGIGSDFRRNDELDDIDVSNTSK